MSDTIDKTPIFSAAKISLYLGAALLIAGGLAMLSFVDDLFTLPTLLRLVAHLAAAGVFLSFAMTTGDDTEIAAGVSGGEKIILDAPAGLADGTSVEEKKP